MQPSSRKFVDSIRTLVRWQFEMRQRGSADRYALRVLEVRITNLTQRRRAGDLRPESQREITAAYDTVNALGF